MQNVLATNCKPEASESIGRTITKIFKVTENNSGVVRLLYQISDRFKL